LAAAATALIGATLLVLLALPAAASSLDYALLHQRLLTMEAVEKPRFSRLISRAYVCIPARDSLEDELSIELSTDRHPLVLNGRCGLSSSDISELVRLVRSSAPATRTQDVSVADIWLLMKDGTSAEVSMTASHSADALHRSHYLLVGADVRVLGGETATEFDRLISRAGCGAAHD
jgi:hypothetical protein